MSNLSTLSASPHDRSADVVVVGAGFSGLYLLHRLRTLEFRVIVLESGGDVGGTWYHNRYPGCRCDVESLQYCYSFSPELEQEWRWTERYPTQPEILKYARHVAERFDLRRDIRFDTRMTAAAYDDEHNVWRVRTQRSTGNTEDETLKCRYLVMASGCLSSPRAPAIAGLENFKGPTYHTAQWPHTEVDLRGQRVGVIGTGSTAIQLIPQVARQAEHLFVFQRTPAYSLPAHNRPIAPGEEAAFKAMKAAHRAKMRDSLTGTLHKITDVSALSLSPEERSKTFESLWREGGAALMYFFSDLMTSHDANEAAAQFVSEKIARVVKDPHTARALTPRNYPIGSKRICIDIDYFETYNRENVTLVALEDEPIESITADGIRTRRRLYELDTLILATGFDALTGALLDIDIRGSGGKPLRDKWRAGPSTYLGLASAGFPNLFMVTGPGSPSVLSNMMVSIEQHVEWIADCLAYMKAHGLDRIEADPGAEAQWMSHVAEAVANTQFLQGASWYLGANIPGKPRVFVPYVGGVGRYRALCAQAAQAGYEGFKLSGHPHTIESPPSEQSAS